MGRIFGAIAPPQSTGIDEYYADWNPPAINAWNTMALRKEGPKALHLNVCQPEKIAHQHPRQFGNLNHAATKTSSRSMGPDLKKQLLAHLRATRAIRRSRHATMKHSGVGRFNDAISLRDRPAELEDRAVPEHWDGDLIAGSGNSFIATLVERNTRYVMLAKVGNKDSHSVIQALIKQSRKLPKELYRSLTWDRGSQIAGHKAFTLATGMDVLLFEPHSPWQRGTNENTNRLLRQYFPKGTDLSIHSQAKLSAVARQLKERPRKTLGYETPAKHFNVCVASTY